MSNKTIDLHVKIAQQEKDKRKDNLWHVNQDVVLINVNFRHI